MNKTRTGNQPYIIINPLFFNKQMKNCLTTMLVVCAMLLSGVSAFAQQKISGTVVDLSGQPVIGAAVIEKGNTSNGAMVDLDGSFAISVPDGSTLVATCIGYADKEFAIVKGQSVYNVVMSEDNEVLEETVVIGYGTVRVKDLTGSVATVGSKDLDVPVANVAQALQGKMAGVRVNINSGAPGAAPEIRIRGNRSITQTNDPLVIVDGFPGNLNNVPADQIKSINVLKDAAATAIYGSRGAAGVILVTTKNAIEGQTTVSYNGYVQVKDTRANIYKVLQPEDYLKFTLGYARDFNLSNYDNMLKYFGIGSQYGNHFNDYVGTKTHNYQNDIYKTGISHSHNLTISNGTKKNKTIFSLNYVYDDGTVIRSWYNRINASLKTVENITDKLSVELNVSYNYTTQFNAGGGGTVSSAYKYRPIDNPRGDANNVSGFGNGSGAVEKDRNPMLDVWDSEGKSHNHGFRGIGAINWKPIEGLTLRSEIGLGKNFNYSDSYTKGEGSRKKTARVNRGESANIRWSSNASYQLPIKNQNHRADIMVGHEFITSNGGSMFISGQEYPSNFDYEKTIAFLKQYTDDFDFNNAINTRGISMSYFTRANYTLMDKYTLTVTFRADGSAKFAPNRRWGYFPAAAFGWRVIDEPFMADAKNWLSNLKLRVSYGTSGSDAISANLWKETWSLGGNTDYTISDGIRTDTELDYGQAYAPGSQMMNNDLKWETTISRNVGIDFGFLKERIYGSAEFYWTTTKDLLMPIGVNSTTGYSTQYANMGQVSNRGIEFSVGGDIVRKGDFLLSANFIYNFNLNRIDALAESVKVTQYGSWASSEGAPSAGEWKYIVGQPIGTIYAYKYAGWYTTDDFNYDPTTQIYTLKPGVPDIALDSFWTSLKRPAGQTAFPGAAKWEDIDKDGKLTETDLYCVGPMAAPHNGSFNLNARWKGFDFSANFNYVFGGRIMNIEALMSSYGSKDNRFGSNRLAVVADAYSPYRWKNGELEHVCDPAELTAMNKNASMHSPTSMKGPLFDKYLENGNFIRLKNLSLGYTVPKSLTKKIGVNNLRAYFTASNVFTLTKYSGLDPEVGGSGTTPGVDRSSYPIARTYTFGINITL